MRFDQAIAALLEVADDVIKSTATSEVHRRPDPAFVEQLAAALPGAWQGWVGRGPEMSRQVEPQCAPAGAVTVVFGAKQDQIPCTGRKDVAEH